LLRLLLRWRRTSLLHRLLLRWSVHRLSRRWLPNVLLLLRLTWPLLHGSRLWLSRSRKILRLTRTSRLLLLLSRTLLHCPGLLWLPRPRKIRRPLLRCGDTGWRHRPCLAVCWQRTCRHNFRRTSPVHIRKLLPVL
jgi:hypothetical protein